MRGWVLIGAIARAGAVVAITESEKMLDNKMKDADSKWQAKLQDIEDRLGPIEKWCGITK